MKVYRLGRLVVLGLLLPVVVGADDYRSLYDSQVLRREAVRLASRVQELYLKGIWPYLRPDEQRALRAVQLQFPTPDHDRHPMSFYTSAEQGRPVVALPILSLKFVEDLSTAYAWLHLKGQSLDTIDTYLTMLKYKPASAFPGGRYPPPLVALGLPKHALDDQQVNEVSLRFRNTAFAFILLHELGHILYRHGSDSGLGTEQAGRHEEQADRFALRVLERSATLPTGALLCLQAQAYLVPTRGQFDSGEAWRRFLRTTATHPLTSQRLVTMAVELDRAAGRTGSTAQRDVLRFMASRLASLAQIRQDVGLQRCIAAAAEHASPLVLTPRPRHSSGHLLAQWCRQEQSSP